jgi:excisionase family DNA binding protein
LINIQTNLGCVVTEPVYTTGDVAKFTGVNFRTVSRWIERGELAGYKLPGRGDHRVPKRGLLEFMLLHSMPIPSELLAVEQKALIVDDDIAMANAIARVLKRDGWEVRTAQDGFEAGMQLMSFNPSLLTLDLRMPQMDGLTVLALTRNQFKSHQLKILAISAQGQNELKKALDSGADGALSKPFENDELRDSIARCFS